jgi:hypothetical protein
MNDINWRSLEDQETWDLLRDNPSNLVLVHTEITYRIDYAQYVEDHPKYGPWLSTSNEKARKVAFV